MPRPPDDIETRSVSLRGGEAVDLLLLAIRPSGVESYPLPSAGRVVIGRGSDADVRVVDPSISRRHAQLDLGPSLRIHDLGSHNGVWVRGRRLGSEVEEIEPGEPVRLGSITVLIQRRVETPEVPPTPAPATSDEIAPPVAGLVARTPAMRDVLALLRRVADSDLSVLLLGETGVGKEVMAEALHAMSPRRSQPLVRLHCAALAPALLESELFGHEKGAFTGALAAKPGLLETAQGGSVFLDEIGELSPATQVKLLRVLEDRRVTRVGGLRPRVLDVRFIAATHRDLAAACARGEFRQDLYFRLNGVAVLVPPLRERRDEIEPLAESFLARLATRLARPVPPLAPATRDLLRAYAWPGNVRELRNVVERAAVLAGDHAISPAQLPPEITHAVAASPPSIRDADRGPDAALKGELAELERRRILEALERCGGNQTKAAQMLQMRRATLVARLDAYGVRRPRKE